MDRDSGAVGWADPAPSSPSGNWTDPPESGEGEWSESAPASAAASSSDGWGESTAAPSSTPAPAKGSGKGWADEGPSYGWGGGESSPSATSAPTQTNNGWVDGGGTGDGWGGGGGLASEPPATSSPSRSGGGGWLGDSEPVSAGSSHGNGGSGWLGEAGGSGSSPSPSNGGGGGWLGDGAGSDNGHGSRAESRGGGGWLGEADSHSAPSMTEMVDQAISVQEDDDFVDDSWVDEEIRDNEFDELEVPEYTAPAPEVGGAFLKMLLVAVLVVLIGGGVMFMKNDGKSAQQTATDSTDKKLEFGRSTAQAAMKDLNAGKPGLAVPQFQAAMLSLSEGKAPKEEIYETEVLLSRALMGSGEYKEAVKHWKSLTNSGQTKYSEEAKKGLNEARRKLRIEANEKLKEAKQYASKDGTDSVLQLAEEALALYNDYGGTNAQKGDAYGVMGRSYMNKLDYITAKKYLKKAVALGPNLGYQTYINKCNNEMRPSSYINPIQYSQPVQQQAPQQPSSAPSFDIGSPGYQTNTNHYYNGGGSSNNGGGNNSASSAAPRPKRMKEIPTFQRNTRSNNSNGQRAGSRGVLQSY